MDGICSVHERYEKSYKLLVWKPEGKGPFGRPKRRWEYLLEYKGKRVKGKGVPVLQQSTTP